MSLFDLSGKIALVTGSGRGIGKGCAVELARAGADVIINDLNDGSDLRATAEEICAMGRQCFPIAGDVFSQQGCKELFSKALSQTGQIDILVSCLLYTSPSPRDKRQSRMPSSA